MKSYHNVGIVQRRICFVNEKHMRLPGIRHMMRFIKYGDRNARQSDGQTVRHETVRRETSRRETSRRETSRRETLSGVATRYFYMPAKPASRRKRRLQHHRRCKPTPLKAHSSLLPTPAQMKHHAKHRNCGVSCLTSDRLTSIETNIAPNRPHPFPHSPSTMA